MIRRRRYSFYRKINPFGYKRIAWLLLVPISFLLRYLTEQNSTLTERIFSGGIYKYYAITLGFLTEKLPFSLMELGICLAVFAGFPLLFFWFYYLYWNWHWKDEILIKSFWNVAAVSSILFFWVTLFCNVNYNRYTFAEISNLTIQPSTTQELYELCKELAVEANELREQLQTEDEYGAFCLENSSIRILSQTAQEGYAKLGEQYKQFNYPAIRAKGILFSRLMSYTDLVGVYCPFTMECNINQEAADYSIPSTICHELAHYYGFMREDEANFIAYLVCKNTEDLSYNYSGTMLALIHAGNQLASVDSEKYYELWLSYSEQVKIDLKKNSEYWAQFKENKVTAVSQAMNDSYLKANNQSDGVKSYGRMVDLLLALYRQKAE